jgi:predicted GNAT family N-acyltransferase
LQNSKESVKYHWKSPVGSRAQGIKELNDPNDAIQQTLRNAALMKVREPKTQEEYEKYYDLRWRILRKPWNQPEGSEKDDLEKQSIHLIACEKGKPLGVGRVHFNSSKEAQIRYMAVEEDLQGKGVGAMILKALEKSAERKGADRIVLNARQSAVGFYKKHGYRIVGKAHTLFGVIPHYKMRKNLES